MTDTVRETKRADELKPGDWLAAGPYNDRIDGTDDAEVLFVHPFDNSKSVAITIQEVTVPQPELIRLHADAEVTLLTEQDIAKARTEQSRDRLSDGLHALADLYQAHELPLPKYALQINLRPKDIDELRVIAEKLDLKIDADTYGQSTTYCIEWPAGHKSYEDGVHVSWNVSVAVEKPAEPEPTKDPSGLGYTRADTDADDPTPVSPARVPLHTGGVVDGGELVDETEPGPVCVYETGGGSAVRQRCGDPIEQGENGLWMHVGTAWHNHTAQPSAQDREREAAKPVHLEIAGAKTMCGLALIDLDTGVGWTNDHQAVTCKACIDGMPF